MFEIEIENGERSSGVMHFYIIQCDTVMGILDPRTHTTPICKDIPSKVQPVLAFEGDGAISKQSSQFDTSFTLLVFLVGSITLVSLAIISLRQFLHTLAS